MMPKSRGESIPSIEPTAASVPLAVPSSRRSSAAAQRERRASKRTPVYNPRPDRTVVLKRRCIVAKFKRNDEAFFHAH